MSRKTYNEFMVCNDNRLILYHGPSAAKAMRMMREAHTEQKDGVHIIIKATNGTSVKVIDNKNPYMRDCLLSEKAYRAKKQEAAAKRNAEKNKKNMDKKAQALL